MTSLPLRYQKNITKIFSNLPPPPDLTHPPQDCPASEPLRHVIFGTTSFILTSGSDLGAWPDCWVSVEFLHAPIPRKGSGSTPTTIVVHTS